VLPSYKNPKRYLATIAGYRRSLAQVAFGAGHLGASRSPQTPTRYLATIAGYQRTPVAPETVAKLGVARYRARPLECPPRAFRLLIFPKAKLLLQLLCYLATGRGSPTASSQEEGAFPLPPLPLADRRGWGGYKFNQASGGLTLSSS